jgi:CubicO group peptidase (beta-lactamase class C family)
MPGGVVGDPSQWNDPGTEPFVPVPEADVAAECKLDINMLKASGYRNGAVFRYGKLCYSNGSIDSPYQVFSVTKSVAGTVMAAAYWETRENDRRILPSDPISEWGGTGSTRISEYAGMVAGAGSGRTWGSHSFAYDTLGTNLAVTRRPMETSLGQGSVSGATNLDAVRDNLFDKLGIRGSWPTGIWGTGANISLTDMGRIGIALSHNGWWNGEQVLDPDWVYWMTHPHWEDGNTSYGMYLWLNHRGNATGIGGTLSASGAGPPGGDPCAPAAIWQKYPHPPSEATDCMPIDGQSCEQMHDTGVFSAQGLNGQFIVAHRGLDLVMVAQNYSGQGGPLGLWELVRPSLVALDPMFMGNEEAFCEAYGNGNYAPDLLVPPVQPPEQ